MKVHPLVLAHGQTYDRRFPLILIVGREPNNSSISDGNKGLMDFVKHSRCAFWNVAFGVFGTINDSGCRQMKSEFIKRRAAPILFADAFPQGIQNAVLDKHSTRVKQSEFAKEQVDALFKHDELIKRVSLVLLSGLNNTIYDNFKELLKEKLTKFNINVTEIPFLYPTNTAKIHNSLSDQDKTLMREVYTSFKMETDVLPELPMEEIKQYEIDAPYTEAGIIW